MSKKFEDSWSHFLKILHFYDCIGALHDTLASFYMYEHYKHEILLSSKFLFCFLLFLSFLFFVL